MRVRESTQITGQHRVIRSGSKVTCGSQEKMNEQDSGVN